MLRVLHKAKPRVAVLTHIILIGVREDTLLEELKNNYEGELYMGEDLMRIAVGSNIKVIRFEK